jgi:hypothetical protein
MLSYLEEGVTKNNPGKDLYIINNTFVNRLPDTSVATFVSIGKADTTPVIVQNNIFYGGGTIITQKDAQLKSNLPDNPRFSDVNNFNYWLDAGSPAIHAATNPGTSPEGYSLAPAFQYVQPACGEARQNASDIGALAYRNKGAKLNCHQ